MQFITLSQSEFNGQPICIAVDRIIAFWTVPASYDKNSFSVIDCGGDWAIIVIEDRESILSKIAEIEKARGRE